MLPNPPGNLVTSTNINEAATAAPADQHATFKVSPYRVEIVELQWQFIFSRNYCLK